MTAALDAALDCAARAWPVSPWGSNGDRKFPLTAHGHLDATVDREVIRDWWTRWPNAIPSIATGERSGVVALDIDVRPDGSGFHTLADDLEIYMHPESPTTHTPRGGCAILFRWPGHFVKTIAGELGKYLDIRGDGGSLLLPPGPGRTWDPYLGIETPLAGMPEWMVIAEPAVLPEEPLPARPQPISRYAVVALDGAVAALLSAPDGQQRDVLNREAFGIGRLVAGGVIPAALALESLQWAARRMRSHDPRRPWRQVEVDKMVRLSFTDGLMRPRQPERRA